MPNRLQKTRDNEALIKTYTDDVNSIRGKLAATSRKETGNYTVRDFTDEIYTNDGLEKRHFVQGMREGFASQQFTNLLCVVHRNKVEAFLAETGTLMNDFYAVLDASETKRRPDLAKSALAEMRETPAASILEFCKKHAIADLAVAEKTAKFEQQTAKLLDELKASSPKDTDEQRKALQNKVDELKASRNSELQSKAEQWQAEFEQGAYEVCLRQIEKSQELARKHRMPFVIVPNSDHFLGLEDADGNQIHRLVVYKQQAEDVIKACRKKGVTCRTFEYDKQEWNAENVKRTELKEQLEIKTKQLNEIAVSCFQSTFVSLMHLKVIRAYIDGVLRFGIPPRFYLGVVFPKAGAERSVLQDLTAALAEESMREMYGEKLDASEADDFWPFVCIGLTSPAFLHSRETKD